MTISFRQGTKIKDGKIQVYIDVVADKHTHYSVKSGIWVEPDTFRRLKKTDKLLSLEWLYDFREKVGIRTLTKQEVEELVIECSSGGGWVGEFEKWTKERVMTRQLSAGTESMYHNVRKVMEEMKKEDPVEFLKVMDEKGLSNTTRTNYWRTFKCFMRYMGVKCPEPVFKKYENDVQFLTHNELYRMMGLELEGKDREVRDLFIIQCMTGIRYSDMKWVMKSRIEYDEQGPFLPLTTTKTRQRLRIRLNQTVMDILDEYKTLPSWGKDMVNDRLPDICRRAQISGRVEIVRYVGNKRTVKVRDRWQCVSTHWARRTFISLCVENGVSTSVIRTMTGHRQLSSFSRYVGVSEKSKINAVQGLEL